MRKILWMAALMCVTSLTNAQDKAIVNFYDKYKNMENATNLNLRGGALKLASSLSDDAEEAKLLRKVTQLCILTVENGKLVSTSEYRKLISDLQRDPFEDLFAVRENGQYFQFLIREKEGTVTDVLVLVSSEVEFMMLSLEGALKFSDLKDLNIEVNGSEHFKKIPDNKKDVPKA